MFEQLSAYDIAIGIMMAFYLICASLYDAHGTAIPDRITLPYALLGGCESLLLGRYMTAAGVFLFSLYIILPLCSHGTLLMQLSANESKISASFEQKYGTTMLRVITAADLIFIVFCLLFTTCITFDLRCGSISLLAIMVTWFLNAIGTAREEFPYPNVGIVAPQIEKLQSGVIGEADLLVFAGIIGFYGIIPSILCLAASFMCYLFWAMLHQMGTQRQQGTYPMLPTLCITIPARLILACTVGQFFSESFETITALGVLHP